MASNCRICSSHARHTDFGRFLGAQDMCTCVCVAYHLPCAEMNDRHETAFVLHGCVERRVSFAFLGSSASTWWAACANVGDEPPVSHKIGSTVATHSCVGGLQPCTYSVAARTACFAVRVRKLDTPWSESLTCIQTRHGATFITICKACEGSESCEVCFGEYSSALESLNRSAFLARSDGF